MGVVKDWMLRQQEEGWQSVGDKFVCADCFEDYALKEFIRQNATSKRCSYCEASSQKPIAVHMDDLLSEIADGLNTEYEDPVQSVSWDSSEGGWIGCKPTHSWDLLEHVGLSDCRQEVLEDLRDAFSDHEWVPVDPYGERPHERLHFTWDAFAAQVKHRTRFVFFRLRKTKTRGWQPSWENRPHFILKELAQITKDLGLVREVPEQSPFFRAHQHRKGERLIGAKRLGTPPPERASHNRMTPAGIPALYVCNDSGTAISETVRPKSRRPMVTVARFSNLRSLRVLDLDAMPDVPSLFDRQRRHLRTYLIFMHRFVEEISLPITEAAKPYEYVPTQVLTEYFRHLFRDEDGKRIDGIAYRSSRNPEGTCYTLFFEQEQCVDSENKEGGMMLLTGAETKRLDNGKVTG